MTQEVQCESPILGIALRVIKLSNCGVPVTGADSASIATAGFVQVQVAPQYDTGDRKILRAASGALCVNHKLPDKFTNDQLTIDYCSWNPGLVVATIGGRLLTASAIATGRATGAAYGEDLDEQHASLEVWQEVSGEGACDPETGDQVYLYHAWPHLTDFKRGQTTINTDPTQGQLIANTKRGSTLWTAGEDWLDSNQLASTDHYLWNFTTTPPPETGCVINGYPASP